MHISHRCDLRRNEGGPGDEYQSSRGRGQNGALTMTDPTPARVYRYPLEPLAEALGLSLNQACKNLGVSGSVQQEYRRRGVTEKVADRLAVKAGLHAFEVWPEMVDHHIEACSIECADERCGELFLPVNGNQKFCSERCQKRANGRRYVRRRYQQDPEWAAARREDSRQRRAEATEAWLRAERRRKNARYDPAARRARYEREKARKAVA